MTVPSVEGHGGTPVAPEGRRSITVVGLGPGSLDQLSLGALQVLRDATVVHVRTLRHPTVEELLAPIGQRLAGPLTLRSCDDLYDHAPSFTALYEQIVSRLVAAVDAEGSIVYAVPGHPLVAERSVALLRKEAAARQIACSIVGSASAIEAVCEAVGADAGEGVQVVDALDLQDELSQPGYPAPWAPLLVLQLYSRRVASDVKLALLRHFPPDHPVQLVQHAGVAKEQRVDRCPLRDLDRDERPDHLSSLWVPPVEELRPLSSLRVLEQVVARLRAPNGCPWDREQTHHTIKRNLVEETYELLEVLDSDDAAGQIEELGDVLFQVFFHAQMGRDSGDYDLGDVTAGIVEKLIRRHPHVFGSAVVSDAEEVLRNWDAIKREEGVGKRSALDGLPPALPALTMALALGSRATRGGIAGPALSEAWPALELALGTLRRAGDQATRADALGDTLFALATLGRLYGLDPEECLRSTNRAFRDRYRTADQEAAERGLTLAQQPTASQRRIWQEAPDRRSP